MIAYENSTFFWLNEYNLTSLWWNMAARQRFEKNISLRFVLSSCLCLAVDAEREEEIKRERRRGRKRVKNNILA